MEELERVYYTHNTVCSTNVHGVWAFFTHTQTHHSNVTAMNWQNAELPKQQHNSNVCSKKGKPLLFSTTEQHTSSHPYHQTSTSIFCKPRFTFGNVSLHPMPKFLQLSLYSILETTSGKMVVTINKKVNINSSLLNKSWMYLLSTTPISTPLLLPALTLNINST